MILNSPYVERAQSVWSLKKDDCNSPIVLGQSTRPVGRHRVSGMDCRLSAKQQCFCLCPWAEGRFGLGTDWPILFESADILNVRLVLRNAYIY